MNQEPSLRLIPDWRRVKQLEAKRMGKTESVAQALLDSGDSLDKGGACDDGYRGSRDRR